MVSMRCVNFHSRDFSTVIMFVCQADIILKNNQRHIVEKFSCYQWYAAYRLFIAYW